MTPSENLSSAAHQQGREMVPPHEEIRRDPYAIAARRVLNPGPDATPRSFDDAHEAGLLREFLDS